MRIMEKETAYFISTATGPVKIGKAKNVVGRLRDLQVSNPEQLSVLGILRGKRGIEKQLHSRFAELRINGEWFRREKPLMDFIIEHTTALETSVKTSKEIELADRVKELETQLKSKGNDLREQVTFEIMDSIFGGLTTATKDSMHSWTLAADELMTLLKNLGRDESLCGLDKYRIEIRRLVDEACGIDWRTAERFLSLESHKLYSDQDFQDAAQKIALDLLKKSLPYDLRQCLRVSDSKLFMIKPYSRGGSYA